jgi:hypothetical protein
LAVRSERTTSIGPSSMAHACTPLREACCPARGTALALRQAHRAPPCVARPTHAHARPHHAGTPSCSWTEWWSGRRRSTRLGTRT